jgi:hypothetical protein
MSGRLREIARQTVAIAEAGEYRNAAGDVVSIADAVRWAIDDTRYYLPEQTLPVPGTPPASMLVEVTSESTLAAARRVSNSCVSSSSTTTPADRRAGQTHTPPPAHPTRSGRRPTLTGNGLRQKRALMRAVRRGE